MYVMGLCLIEGTLFCFRSLIKIVFCLLVSLSTIVNCAEPPRRQVIVQHSGASSDFHSRGCSIAEITAAVTSAFGSFDHEAAWGEPEEVVAGVFKYASTLAPAPAGNFAKLQEQEKLLHSVAVGEFLELIREVKKQGKCAFVPETIQENPDMRKLVAAKEYVKPLAASIVAHEGRIQKGQRKFFQTILDLNDYFEAMSSIDSKTYCGAAISFEYKVEGGDTQNRLIMLPYLFVSDGMEPVVIDSMEQWLKARPKKTTSLLDAIRVVDYYSRDTHDTQKSLGRVHDTLLEHNSIHRAIKAEAAHIEPDFLTQIRKFAHAEQRVLDRVSEDLPKIISLIEGNNITIQRVRLHMIVNNDSCCRCDATIKAAIEPKGWLFKRLRCAISELAIEGRKTVTLADSLQISAAISSTTAYNSGEPLIIDGCELRFYSRGLKELALQAGAIVGTPKGLPAADSARVLKVYGFDER